MRNPTKKPISSRRIHLLDEIRGFAVLCMIFYHGFHTLSLLLNWSWAQTLLEFFTPAEPWFAGAFIFLSGIAANLTRSNLGRGLRLAVVAVVVSLVTIFFVPGQPIYFGILHLLCVSMILVGLIKRFLDKIPIWAGIAVCAAAYLFTMGISRRFLGIASLPLIPLPDSWYQTDWLAPLGIYSPGFFSAVYFPILPWIFVFLGGTFFGRYAAMGKFPAFTYRSTVPALSYIGRHALIFYIVHQPVIYGAAWIIQRVSA